MAPALPIHQVYTEQLLPLGHGYPLWDAEPEDKKYEVEIGTVGRIDSGKFWLLFNAMKPADDPYQKHGVPATYEPLSLPSHAPQGPWEKIKSPLVVSQTVCNRDVAAALQAGTLDGTISAGGSLKFNCCENTGAFLLLERPAVALVLPAKDRIVRYMRDNFEHWLEFANADNGLMLRPEELYFVHGTVKTRKWATGAFHGNCRNREGAVQAQFMEVGSFDLSISISTEEYTRMEYNYGPTGRDLEGASSALTARPLADADVVEGRGKCDQCIFFNYFKVKKRLLIGPKYMAAAAGPHPLPPPDRDDFTDGGTADGGLWLEEDFEEMPAPVPATDPVDFLLDYILANSEAKIAIACDTELYSLFQGCGYPADVPAALKSMKPMVRVDECGAGTLLADTDYTQAGSAYDCAHLPSINTDTEDIPSSPDLETRTPVSYQPRRPEVKSASPQMPPWWEPALDDPESAPWSDRKARPFVARSPKPRRKPAPWSLPDTSDGYDADVITASAVSPNCKWVARGYDEGTIVLQQVAQRSLTCAWDGHDDFEGVRALAFSPDSTRLVSAHDDGSIMVWDVEHDEQLAALYGHSDAATILAWSPDGTRLASASEDFTVRLWNTETYRPLFLLAGHDEPLIFLKFSPNGRWLVSGGEDCFCLLWDVASGELHQELDGHDDPVRAADFDTRSARVVTCADDATARVWSVETGEELLRLEAHRSAVRKAAFSRDGARVLTVSGTTAKIHDAYSGERQFTFKGADAIRRAFQTLERRLE